MSKRVFTDGFIATSIRNFAAGFLLVFAGQSVQADELSYSYVEVEYVASGDFLGGDLDGFIISGSAEIGETFFVLGSYNDGEIESALDLEVLRLGFGLHGSISESLDWVGSLEYVDFDLSGLSRLGLGISDSYDESGYILDLGIRGIVDESVEYSVAIIQSDVGGSETGFRVGGRYHFGDSNVSAGLDYVRYESDWDQLELGVRYQFD